MYTQPVLRLVAELRVRYKDAGDALKRKQDKEREAAGLSPVQRVGARGAAPRGQRGGPGTRGGQRGFVRGGGPARTTHTAADKNLYVHLIGHLRKKDLLPVVVFTFSKKRCEENAATLTNADLCTSVEKSEVHVAIERALSRLKGEYIVGSGCSLTSRVLRLRQKAPSDWKNARSAVSRNWRSPRWTIANRQRGMSQCDCARSMLFISIPKVVEILFARGLVKVLFATETFAMVSIVLVFDANVT